MFFKINLLSLASYFFGILFCVGIAFSGFASQRRDTVLTALDEVNVVAQKQDAKLRDDALSATVLSVSAIEKANALNLRSLSDMVPNLFIPDYGSRITSTIYIRGIGARMDQPAVGLIVDNVPILNKNLYDFDVEALEWAEVLRGPQSTLYGRNTMSGLINLSTLNPMRWQGIKGSVEVGSRCYGRFNLIGSRSISKQKAASISISGVSSRGQYKNDYNGAAIGGEHSVSARHKFIYRPSGDLYMQNVASVGLISQSGYPYESVKSGRVEYNDTCFYERVSFLDGFTLNYHTDRYRLTSVTSLQLLADNLTLDNDFLSLDYFTLTQKEREAALTQDVVVKGEVGDGLYKWLGGFFGFVKGLNMAAPVVIGDDGIRNMIENNRNNANPYYPIKWDTRSLHLNSDFGVNTFGVAFYHESKVDLDRWHFAVGVRGDFEQNTLKYHNQCLSGYEIFRREDNGELTPFHHAEVYINDSGNLKRHYLTWLPRVSMLYDLTSDPSVERNVYISFSKGGKAGGFNTQMFSEVLQQRLMRLMGIGSAHSLEDMVGYKPEYSWNYEIGSHLSFFDNRLNADMAVFHVECRDQQMTVFPEGTTTGRVMTNAGRTRSFGCEASVNARIADWLVTNISYGYTDARFRQYNTGLADYAGCRIPYVPNHTLYLQSVATWRPKQSYVDAVDFDLNWRGTGRIYWNEANSLSQNPYGLLGASVTAVHDSMSLQLWGRNLTGTKYDTFYFKSMGNEFLQRGRPWQVGLTLRVVFDK